MDAICMSQQPTSQEVRGQFLKRGTLLGAALSTPLAAYSQSGPTGAHREFKEASKAVLPGPEPWEAGKAACRLPLLAWLMAQKPWIVPIPGTTKLDHLNENLAAAAFEFTANELRQFNDTISKIKVTGARFTGEQAGMVGK